MQHYNLAYVGRVVASRQWKNEWQWCTLIDVPRVSWRSSTLLGPSPLNTLTQSSLTYTKARPAFPLITPYITIHLLLDSPDPCHFLLSTNNSRTYKLASTKPHSSLPVSHLLCDPLQLTLFTYTIEQLSLSLYPTSHVPPLTPKHL